jgi:hypothetical protein
MQQQQQQVLSKLEMILSILLKLAGILSIYNRLFTFLKWKIMNSSWYREFEANVVVLHHSTTVTVGYEPVIHCGVLRQSAEMVDIQGREALRTGERAMVRFRFMYFADFILPGSTFLFREGRAKGNITILLKCSRFMYSFCHDRNWQSN